jgi:hypothetical protein
LRNREPLAKLSVPLVIPRLAYRGVQTVLVLRQQFEEHGGFFFG